VDDLEQELYTNHPPRSFTASFAFDESDDNDSDASFVIKEEEEEEEGRETRSPMTPDSSLTSAPTIQHAKSQPRRPRPRLKKKTPKMTDFFGKQS
jgi:hypothetical protein